MFHVKQRKPLKNVSRETFFLYFQKAQNKWLPGEGTKKKMLKLENGTKDIRR